MEKYEIRKQELVNATKRYLLKNGAFIAIESEGPVFTPKYYGSPRQERILEVYLTDKSDIVVVTQADGNTGHSLFHEFSNEEMEEIMRLTGISADTDKAVVDDIVEYGSRYGLDALGYAFREMVRSGEISLSPEDAEHLWEYGGNTENQL